TWAYEEGSEATGFVNYNNDQASMFNAIVNTVQEAAQRAGIDIIIPTGTAIQNGRATALGDKFCRDGMHLNAWGKYTAACTWVEKLLGKSAIESDYIPDGIPATGLKLMQQAAHDAVQDPYTLLPVEPVEPETLPENSVN